MWPSIAPPVLAKGARNMKPHQIRIPGIVWLVLGIMVIGAAAMPLYLAVDRPIPHKSQEPVLPVTSPKPNMPGQHQPVIARRKKPQPFYKIILSKLEMDAPILTRRYIKIAVARSIADADLERLMIALCRSSIPRSQFDNLRGHTNQIHIQAFNADEINLPGLSARVIAYAEMETGKTPRVTIHRPGAEILRQLPLKSVAFIREHKRKEIYVALVRAEDEALREAEQQYPYDAESHLGIDQQLVLRISVALMPTLESDGTVSQLGRILSLPIGTTITIRGITRVRYGKKIDTPWYYVSAVPPNQTFQLTGWINGLGLVGHFEPGRKERAEKEFQLEQKLRTIYRGKVGKEYGLSEKQLLDISVEAGLKYWPMPELRQN